LIMLLSWLPVHMVTLQILKIMSAPNVLSVGTRENIFFECQGCSDEVIPVNFKVTNFPSQTVTLDSGSVILNKQNDFQQFGNIMINPDSFVKDPNIKQYVHLEADFQDYKLGKVVMVTFQAGFIFIQTDKTLYTPNSKVHYRMFAVAPSMEPVKAGDNHADTSVSIEIVTPDEVTLSLPGPVSLISGMYSGDYDLGEYASNGIWKVVARFPSNPQFSFSTEFEVKEYVLPNFEVTLEIQKNYFHVDWNEYNVRVQAIYLFGEDVEGTAYAVFGVIMDDQKINFPGSLQRVTLDGGEAQVTLRKKAITDTFPDINSLVEKSIYVTVNVLTEDGGEMVKAELRNIQIVQSPYAIQFTKTSKFFKPGMDFDVMVEVLNPDGTPADQVQVTLNPGAVEGRTEENGMARLSINTKQTDTQLAISATTNVPGITQATASMTAHLYNSKSKSYLHIGVGKAEVSKGENLKVNFNYNRQSGAQSDITYLILSRGQLVKYGRYTKSGEVVVSTIILVTKEMMPSFRIIAYYHTADGEVVSDSVWVDVEDTCIGSLKLEPKESNRNSFEPGESFQLKVTGDPEAQVGLVAVDKGVFLLNSKFRLTQAKVWDIVEKHDPGCTAGGGQDGMMVFYDAGLAFKTNMDSETSTRTDLKCGATTARRKKRTPTGDFQSSMLSKYADKKVRGCCFDGMKEVPVSYDCQRRSQFVLGDARCVAAYLECCTAMKTQRAEMQEDSLILARSEEDDSINFRISEVVSRSKFPESWHWTSVTLPACSDPTCRTTSIVTKPFPLKDSITTWQFIGIGLSKANSICVAPPLEVIARKDFFLKLILPYSVVRGEQVEIKAIIYNYRSSSATVYVDMLENQDVCSGASGHGRYREKIRVPARGTRSVSFVIIGMKIGLLDIDVRAVVHRMDISDGEKRPLRVVPEGVLTKTVVTETLEPRTESVQKTLNSGISPKKLVPGIKPTTQISITGREQLGSLVENAISGNSMGSLITQPGGCGEQNMIGMTLPVIAVTYLDKTNQWEVVGFNKRTEALQYITTGYHNEIPYRKSDGSFAVFKDYDGSTWLTAYVAKVFAMAYPYVGIDYKVICGAISFLIDSQQDTNGRFRDSGTIIHGEMIGNVRGTDADVSMTAFCLIAMQESRTLCRRIIPKINLGITYLKGRLESISNPYAAAIASYALANENALNHQILFKFMSPAGSHWPVHDSHLFTLEATAYALLALVKAFEEAKPIVRWFNGKQKYGGGYGSTQATIMVYQAVAEYWTSANEQPYDVSVELSHPGRSKPLSISLNKLNHYATKKDSMEGINKDVTVTATGNGEVVLLSVYYVLPYERESNCKKFNLSVQILPDKNEITYKLKIEVMFLDRQKDAIMAIVDVGMLTGFSVYTNDLDALSKGTSKIISHYDINSPLSERGSVILYLDKISHSEKQEISFRIQQDLKGKNLQPAAVTVYEYYDHQNKDETHCMKFYHPKREGGELMRLCSDENRCTCAEEECTLQKKENVNNDERIMKTCESTEEVKTDFVYKVKVESFLHKWGTDIYTLKILSVIKEGTDVGVLDKSRDFLSHRRCRSALNLLNGKTYLIMGVNRDVRVEKTTSTFQYVLGERTWVEYWPTAEECQTTAYASTCKGIEDLEYKYSTFACNSK
uniref:Complement C3-like n=1 Tax=Echeneis naucrates TaxID=173247 RepID=A0A665W556_ECHNA